MDGDSNVDSLREQFQQLQEQHQKKLLLRKQRISGSSSVNKNETSNNIANSDSRILGCEMEDNLELELEGDFVENLPRNENADNMTRELKDENGRLRKLLAERDEEMRILRKQVNQERQNMIGSGLAADTAANRIMELSKKNREFASDIEKEKRKVKQLSKKLNELQNQNIPGQSDGVGSKNEKVVEKSSSDEEKVNSKQLQERLKQALAKVADYRNQCEILKKEIKINQKVIAKECGDGVNITAILNEPSGWRGRQQQIISLQNKVNELRQQLNEAANAKLAAPSHNLQKPSLNFQRVPTPSFHDEKHKHMLRTLEKNKKEAYEKVSSELETLTEEHSKLQKRFGAAKTRNEILTNDLKGVKAQAKMLIDKGAHDDELIAALMREQERLQKTLDKKNSQIAADRNHSRQEKVQQDSELVQTLTRLCKEREEKVAKLEQELNAIVINKDHAYEMSAELVDKATITDNCFTSNVSSPVVEFQPNGRDDSRDVASSNCNTDPSLRRRRVLKSSGTSSLPPTPPRSRPGAMSSEGRSHKHEEYRALYEAIKVERDRLVELVAVLQEREKEARQSVYKISCDVKNLQRQNVEMEKKLARISSGQNSCPRQERGRKHQNTQRQKLDNGEPTNSAHHVEELRTTLAIQKDENDALKEALDATLQGKKEDFLFYQDIVEQTKQVFLQGLHQYRQTSAPT